MRAINAHWAQFNVLNLLRASVTLDLNSELRSKDSLWPTTVSPLPPSLEGGPTRELFPSDFGVVADVHRKGRVIQHSPDRLGDGVRRAQR